jgi:putative endonuclease
MRDIRTQIGRFGESAAAAHLQRAGYQIIARNWRCPIGEIDLIARDGAEIVFVEVRTRRDSTPPAESVGRAKQRRLLILAQLYLQGAADDQQPWRIDVIAVTIGRGGRVAQIEHLQSAVES